MTQSAKPSLNILPLKARMKVPRQCMPEQSPEMRATCFTEVNLGYSPELARQEALRCLECAKPACTDHCPVGVRVREFVQLIVAGDFLAAAAKIRENNVLPAITGRVCPQEDHCEGSCLMGKKVKPLGIGYLERFVADYEQRMGVRHLPQVLPTGKKIAVVGSGPSGLTVAGDLVQKGHQVRVFEALHELGGVLVYGIPEFRLPKQIIREQIDSMRAMGVEFETDVVVGRTVTIDELMEEEGYDAVFIGTGAGLPVFMNIPGEHLNGVYSANEFLTRINLMKAYKFPTYDEPMVDLHGKDVAVIGGGNTALDAVRSALRLGARKAHVIYRRSGAEMPARQEEAKHARGRRHCVSHADQSGRVPAGCRRLAWRGPLCAHGTRGTRRLRTPAPGSDYRFGVRSASIGGCDCYRHKREYHYAENDARLGNRQARLHPS